MLALTDCEWWFGGHELPESLAPAVRPAQEYRQLWQDREEHHHSRRLGLRFVSLEGGHDLGLSLGGIHPLEVNRIRRPNDARQKLAIFLVSRAGYRAEVISRPTAAVREGQEPQRVCDAAQPPLGNVCQPQKVGVNGGGQISAA